MAVALSQASGEWLEAIVSVRRPLPRVTTANNIITVSRDDFVSRYKMTNCRREDLLECETY